MIITPQSRGTEFGLRLARQQKIPKYLGIFCWPNRIFRVDFYRKIALQLKQ